jgi:Collagen triple helix repeat (20 copies)
VPTGVVVSRRPIFATIALLCAALVLLALGIPSAWASPPPSHTQSIDSPNSLNAISCVPHTTDCVVADSDGNALDATNVSVSASATWASWSGPVGEKPGEAVACSSRSLCVLADGVPEPGEPSVGGNMYYATSLGGSWTEAFNPAFGVVAISCASSSFCVAGAEGDGDIRYTTNPASSQWTAEDGVGTGAMNGVDCLSSSFCAVVNGSGHVYVADTAEKIKQLATGWIATDIDGSTPLHGIACTSSTSCFAVDGEGNVLDLTIDGNGEATVFKHDIDATNDLTAITCTESFLCVAVDSKGNVFVSSDGGTTWNEQLTPGGDLTSVSCASSSLCVTADTAGSVTAFASPLFPLAVFVTGEGEVTLAPAGLKCAAEECSYAFAGEVTLTAAKAGAGYEFAGWIGCRKASATTCTVDVTAASEVTAVFLKAAREGPTGKEGQAGKEGEAGNEGKLGATGPTGEKGALGARGEKGPAGPTGPRGLTGKVELVTCRTARGRQQCTAKLVSDTVKVTTTGSAARVTLSRRGVVYAAGTARLGRGRMSLRLLPVRRLRPGGYTLTLISGAGRHERISSESFTLR